MSGRGDRESVRSGGVAPWEQLSLLNYLAELETRDCSATQSDASLEHETRAAS